MGLRLASSPGLSHGLGGWKSATQGGADPVFNFRQRVRPVTAGLWQVPLGSVKVDQMSIPVEMSLTPELQTACFYVLH